MAADPRPSSPPRADPYEHPANAARDDEEQREAQCRHLKSCDRCTLADGCGWCVDKLISGDGTTAHIMATCVAGNQTFPGAVPDSHKCSGGYHHLVCPCPNQCSGHGTCQPTGECLCFRAFEGEDCSKERDAKMNPAVVIPICITLVGIAVGAIVAIHLKQSKQARSSAAASNKDKCSDSDAPATPSDTDYASADGSDIQLLSQRQGFNKMQVQ
eukprot:g710.t1